MLKQDMGGRDAGKKNPPAPVMAGRAHEFWKNLLGKEPPTAKPEPKLKVVIERLPPGQLKQIIDNFRVSGRDSRSGRAGDLSLDRDFIENVANQTWDGIVRDLCNLHPRDGLEILTAAMDCGVDKVEKKAVKLIPKMPEGSWRKLMKAALEIWEWGVRQEAIKLMLKMPEEFQTNKMLRSAARAVKEVLEAQRGEVRRKSLMPLLELQEKLRFAVEKSERKC